MRVYISNASRFDGTAELIKFLLSIISPAVKKADTEYAIRLENESACVFRVNIGEKPRLIPGSMLAQTAAGSLKIGFVDIHDENIEGSIRTLIQEHWRIVQEDSNAECAVVYSPILSEKERLVSYH